ncbi:MAG: hypothetical protein ACRD4T_00075 [Candidatus Acidiferrales bacterium]
MKYSVRWLWEGTNPSAWPIDAPNLMRAVCEALTAPAIREGLRRLEGLDIEYGGAWVRFRRGGVKGCSYWDRLHPDTRAVLDLDRFTRAAWENGARPEVVDVRPLKAQRKRLLRLATKAGIEAPLASSSPDSGKEQ